MRSLQDCHGTVRVVYSNGDGNRFTWSKYNHLLMVLQAVSKTNSKLVVEEGEVEIQLTP